MAAMSLSPAVCISFFSFVKHKLLSNDISSDNIVVFLTIYLEVLGLEDGARRPPSYLEGTSVKIKILSQEGIVFTINFAA